MEGHLKEIRRKLLSYDETPDTVMTRTKELGCGIPEAWACFEVVLQYSKGLGNQLLCVCLICNSIQILFGSLF